MGFLGDLDTVVITKPSPRGLPQDLSFSLSGAPQHAKKPAKKPARHSRLKPADTEAAAILQAFFLRPLDHFEEEEREEGEKNERAHGHENAVEVEPVAEKTEVTCGCVLTSALPCASLHLHPLGEKESAPASEEIVIVVGHAATTDGDSDDDDSGAFVDASVALTGKGKRKVIETDEFYSYDMVAALPFYCSDDEDGDNDSVIIHSPAPEADTAVSDEDEKSSDDDNNNNNDVYDTRGDLLANISFDDFYSYYSEYDGDDGGVEDCCGEELEDDFELSDFKQRGGSVARASQKYKKEKINPDRYVNARAQRREGELATYLARMFSAVKANRVLALAKELSLLNERRLAGRFGGRTPHPFSQRSKKLPARRSAPPVFQPPRGQDISSIELHRMAQTYGVTPQIMDQIQKLQWKENLKPEDYELLVLLDQAIKPKTVAKSKVTNMPKRKLTEEDIAKIEGACPICMATYLIGDFIKTLPCGHFFHSTCIEYWLLNASTKCPSDGLPIDM